MQRTGTTGMDAESRAWVDSLSASGHERDAAVERLHDLLLRAARFEVGRRHSVHLRDMDDIAEQCASDALMAVLSKLHTFRGDSRFTTWAYKFALLEAAVAVRRRAWQGRELPLPDAGWEAFAASSGSPDLDSERGELIAAIRDAIADELTEHQREVLVATTLNGVPIDVLAERLGTTRGALYKTLHDARRKLRARLAARGLFVEGEHA